MTSPPDSAPDDRVTRGERAKLTRLRATLIGWYQQHGRQFPWREPTASTFERICVEVLLQRTRAETVAVLYPRFFSYFPDWDSIARARPAELECVLRPIGLWHLRARSLKQLATYAAARGGVFPADPDELAKVPAVGQYVRNAILLFQHGKSRPLVDVNMSRVLERFLRRRRLSDIRYDPWLQGAAHWLVRGQQAIETNWACLDFASAVCIARTPRCSSCPLFSRCRAKGPTPLVAGAPER